MIQKRSENKNGISKLGSLVCSQLEAKSSKEIPSEDESHEEPLIGDGMGIPSIKTSVKIGKTWKDIIPESSQNQGCND